MKQIRAWAIGMVLVAMTGCNKDKDEAIKEAENIEAACKAGNQEEASKLGQDLYAKNAAFKKAADEAAKTWNISDPAKMNFCGPVFVEVKSRLSL
jgi:thymidine phosphorylase